MIKKISFFLFFSFLLFGSIAFVPISSYATTFSLEFGTSGNDEGEFDKLSNVVFDTSNDLMYVADTDNNRIQIFDLDGSCSGSDELANDICFIEEFGTSGNDEGEFDAPSGLALNTSDDLLYVADTDNNRIQIIDVDGSCSGSDELANDICFIEEFGTSGNDEGKFRAPSGLALNTSDDLLYVADTDNNRIQIIDVDGSCSGSDELANDICFIEEFGTSGNDEGKFRAPSGLALNTSDDLLYVADTDNNRIQIIDVDGSCSGSDELANDICFIEEFGTSGNDEGEFDAPSGLALNTSDDLLYVADTDNNRIQIIDVDGSCSGSDELANDICFIEEFGTSGNDEGKFRAPSGLALNTSDDLLYVADTDNNRIQILDTSESSSATTFSLEFGTSGNDEGEFDKLSNVVFDTSNDLMYVADTDNNRIQIFDLDGSCSGSDELANDICFIEEFGTSGNDEGEFDAPSGLALNTSDDLLYVADTDNNRIQIIDVDGSCSGSDELANDICFIEEFGTSGNDEGEFDAPSGLALNTSDDLLYVADTDNNRIQIIDVDGSCSGSDELANDICFIEEFGTSGNDEGKFRAPSGLALNTSDDLLYVADTDNNRIQIIDVDGSCSGSDELANDICFIEEFGTSGNDEGKFRAPSGLALNTSDDLLYVADTDNNRIQIIDVDGSCSGSDELANDICFIEEFGTSGNDEGKFRAPSGLALNTSDDLLYVADTDNNRIQILSILESSGGDNNGGSSSSSNDVPDSPRGLKASAASPSSIAITWNTPDLDDDDPKITGYKIEAKEGNGSYETIVADTKSTATSFLHTGLDDGETYRYRVYAINSEGTSNVSSTASAKPGTTKTPAGLTAVPISKNQILLSWLPPSETFNQSITGYIIEREIISDVLYENVNSVSGSTTTYTVTGLETGKTYSYVVSAEFSVGSTPRSDAVSATPELDSKPASTSSSSSSVTAPTAPRNLKANESLSQIQLSWNEPSSDGNSKITGYKIEVKKDSGSYSVLKSNTNTSATSYVDSNVQMGSTYTYRIYAINSVGTSSPSVVSATPQDTTLQLSPLGKFTIDEKKTLSFTVKITDSSLNNVVFSLEKSPPVGAKINSNTGLFTWTPTDSQGAKSYVFDIVAKKDSMVDRQSVTITVNDVKISEPIKEPEPTTEPKDLGIASFVDETKDPQSYVDRYNNETTYKEWFDDNFAEYDSIYQAVGLEEPLLIPAAFVDETKDPQSYVDRYNNETTYKEWFDDNFAEYDSIYQAVGLEEPKVEEKKFGICGPGTKLIEGVCTIVEIPDVKPWWHFW